MPSNIEEHYQDRMDSLSPKERVERSMAMLQCARELIGTQLLAESGPMSDGRLKWEVAKRLYASDPKAVAMIDRQLADISR